MVLGRLSVQHWQCKACGGSASPLSPDVTSRQRPQTFRELVCDLYVYSVSLRGLSRILALPGCGVGAARHDPQTQRQSWVEVDETWLSIGGEQRPVAVVPGPKGERLDLCPAGPGFDWGDWFTDPGNGACGG